MQESGTPWVRLEMLPSNMGHFQQVVTSAKGQFLQKDFAFYRKKMDEKRALMSPDVRLLHYPFEPKTRPEGIDPDVWREAFTQARLFLLGTKFDSIKSQREVALLMGAVHADFVFLGLPRPQAQFLVGSPVDYDEVMRVSQKPTEQWLAQRFARAGIPKEQLMAGMEKRQVKVLVGQLHAVHEIAQKSMARWSEFRAAREALLSSSMRGYAGFVMGLETDDLTDRLTNFSEEVLFEEIAHHCTGREADDGGGGRLGQWAPRFGREQRTLLLYWAKALADYSEMTQTLAFRFRKLPFYGTYLAEDPFKKMHEAFDDFLEKTFPGFRMALVARQDRQIVRSLHTLMHRGTIEKLAAAQRSNLPGFLPVTVIAIVGHRNAPGICDIWDRQEELYIGSGIAE